MLLRAPKNSVNGPGTLIALVSKKKNLEGSQKSSSFTSSPDQRQNSLSHFPVALPCGHVVGASCLKKSLQDDDSCFECGATVFTIPVSTTGRESQHFYTCLLVHPSMTEDDDENCSCCQQTRFRGQFANIMQLKLISCFQWGIGFWTARQPNERKSLYSAKKGPFWILLMVHPSMTEDDDENCPLLPTDMFSSRFANIRQHKPISCFQ